MITTNINIDKNPENKAIIQALQESIIKHNSKYDHFLFMKNNICKLVLRSIYHTEFEVIRLNDGQAIYFEPEKLSCQTRIFIDNPAGMRIYPEIKIGYSLVYDEIQKLRKQTIFNRLRTEKSISRDYFYKIVRDVLNEKEGERIKFLTRAAKYSMVEDLIIKGEKIKRDWQTGLVIKGSDYWEKFPDVRLKVEFPNLKKSAN